MKLLNTCVYKLDIIILDEILLLPTWLHVPTFSTRLDRVDVTFRISGRYNRKKEKSWRHSDAVRPYARYAEIKGFRRGCGGTGPAMRWQIYSVLKRFIEAGPRSKVALIHVHRHVIVKVLHINVETPQHVDHALFGPPRSNHPKCRVRHESSVLSPRFLAEFIVGEVKELLSHRAFEYGTILYEHVDTVVVSLDGAELKRFDIADYLRDTPGYCEYKKATWGLRRERGLRVLGKKRRNGA
jgi:hypothetical protein